MAWGCGRVVAAPAPASLFAPRVLAVPLGLAPEAAYWAGAVVTPSRAQGNAPVVSGALLLVVLAIHWTGCGMLYRRASRADVGFAAAGQEAHDQYVVLSRNIERRDTNASCTTPC